MFYVKHNYRAKYEIVNEMETFLEDQETGNNKATINLPSMEIRYDIWEIILNCIIIIIIIKLNKKKLYIDFKIFI